MRRVCAAMVALLIFGMATFSLCALNGIASQDHPDVQPSIFASTN